MSPASLHNFSSARNVESNAGELSDEEFQTADENEDSSTEGLRLLDLPNDVFVDNILPLLDPKDYLSLCSSSPRLWSFRQEASYWRPQVLNTFRISPQVLRRNDGQRWVTFYRRLQNESKAFMWGGVKLTDFQSLTASHPDRPSPQSRWPLPYTIQDQNPIIVDVQCGGHGQTVRTSQGKMFARGSISTPRYHVSAVLSTPLVFPSDLEPLQPESKFIVQSSAGRQEVLGLAKDGCIWAWLSSYSEARLIRFIEEDLQTTVKTAVHPISLQKAKHPRGIVSVRSGWAGNCAYLEGRGITIWQNAAEQRFGTQRVTFDDETEARSMAAPFVPLSLVPGTGFLRSETADTQFNARIAPDNQFVGEVVGYALLEGEVLVFLTDEGKVYVSQHCGIPVLLTSFTAPAGEEIFTQVEGSFRNFALMNTAETVYIGSMETLRAWLGAEDYSDHTGQQFQPLIPRPLQKRGIISLSFGDWHHLALTAKGKVFGFGHEPEHCGCLGLGTTPAMRLMRGEMQAGGEIAAPEQGVEVMFTQHEEEAALLCARYGQRGAAAFKRITAMNNMAEGSLSSTFAYQISAGGWGSAALVLVDEEKTAQERVAIGKILQEEIPNLDRDPALQAFLPAPPPSKASGFVGRMIYALWGSAYQGPDDSVSGSSSTQGSRVEATQTQNAGVQSQGGPTTLQPGIVTVPAQTTSTLTPQLPRTSQPRIAQPTSSSFTIGESSRAGTSSMAASVSNSSANYVPGPIVEVSVPEAVSQLPPAPPLTGGYLIDEARSGNTNGNG